jgi:hypothetical protein
MGEMEGLLDRYWVSTTVMVVVVEGVLEGSFVRLFRQHTTPLVGWEVGR